MEQQNNFDICSSQSSDHDIGCERIPRLSTELEASLPFPANGLYPEPDETSPHSHYLFL
jgi:hypothetical protein